MDFINITYKGKAILEQPITSTLSKTIQQIQMLTDLPHNAQKLILFGKNINNETNQPLQLSQSIPSLKSKQKAVIMVIGSDSNALEFIEKKNSIQKFDLPVYKPSLQRTQTTPYTFHSYTILPGLPFQEKATSLLHQIASSLEPLMKKNQYSVGALIELHPLTDASILGYNQNHGQVIAIRLRTDDLTGFRNYNDILKVMVHELAHMKFSEHDNQFKELNSLHARELKELDWRQSKGRRLVEGVEFYDPDKWKPESKKEMEMIDGEFVHKSKGYRLGDGKDDANIKQSVADAAIKRNQPK